MKIHFNRRSHAPAGRYACARAVRNQEAARERRRHRLWMSRQMHAGPPPSWPARAFAWWRHHLRWLVGW